jgi:hypothetical protein
MKNSKTANINITIKDLFKKWLDITKLFHKLTNQELDVLALLLYYHYKYKQEITNDKILWKIVFDYDTKHLIKEELDIKDQGIQNVLSNLRKKNIIDDGKIRKAYIPDLEDKGNNFKIIFNFNIIHD